MRRGRFIVSGISAAAVGGVLAADACSSSRTPLQFNPAVFAPNSLESGVHTLRLQYAKTRIAGYTLRTRTYNGSTVGPTVETRPGETLSFRIVNRLPENPPHKAPTGSFEIPTYTDAMSAMMGASPIGKHRSTQIDLDNNPHGFNTTNLHVHGIQTFPHLFTPLGTSDPAAMMIEIEPGHEFRYDFTVPKDHPSGLFWYHPHKHGSTDVQVSGGMAGLIVMRGPIDDVPEIKAARELFVVMQSLEVNAAPGKTNLYEREYLPYQTPANGGYRGFTFYTMFTINGRGIYWVDNTANGSNGYNNVFKQLTIPEVEVAPGEVVRLRMLNGNNVLVLLLKLAGFDVWQIGFDGINLLAPALKDMSGTGVSEITTDNYQHLPLQVLAPGNRLELLLRAPNEPGTYDLQSLGSKDVSGLGLAPATMSLTRFVVRGPAKSMAIPKTLPTPVREYPLIRDDEIVARRTFRFSLQFPSTLLLTGVAFRINDELYDMTTCPTHVRLGTCEEWRIENEDHTEPHPFHIHTNSFQLIAVNDVPVEPVQIWDTFPVPPKSQKTKVNGSITFRIRFKEWTGKDVFHCHILDHEDTGMMRNFLIE